MLRKPLTMLGGQEFRGLVAEYPAIQQYVEVHQLPMTATVPLTWMKARVSLKHNPNRRGRSSRWRLSSAKSTRSATANALGLWGGMGGQVVG